MNEVLASARANAYLLIAADFRGPTDKTQAIKASPHIMAIRDRAREMGYDYTRACNGYPPARPEPGSSNIRPEFRDG